MGFTLFERLGMLWQYVPYFFGFYILLVAMHSWRIGFYGIRVCLPDALIVHDLIPINVQVASKTYQASAKAELSNEKKSAKQLVALLDNLEGNAVFSIWGFGDYRIEGPLLTCDFVGDGLGHFKVDVKFSEEALKLADFFTTDQTCLKSFIEALQTFG